MTDGPLSNARPMRPNRCTCGCVAAIRDRAARIRKSPAFDDGERMAARWLDVVADDLQAGVVG